jgi:hypothetical protein
MKPFLTVSSVLEILAGLALIGVPALFVSMLLGSTLEDQSSLLMTRLAGGALTALGLACWLSRNDVQSSVMVKVMLVYNAFCVSLLLYAALAQGISSQGLWPAMVVHLGMLIWSIKCLWKH